MLEVPNHVSSSMKVSWMRMMETPGETCLDYQNDLPYLQQSWVSLLTSSASQLRSSSQCCQEWCTHGTKGLHSANLECSAWVFQEFWLRRTQREPGCCHWSRLQGVSQRSTLCSRCKSQLCLWNSKSTGSRTWFSQPHFARRHID